jgi:polar amino acid transport system substrate-binding protein
MDFNARRGILKMLALGVVAATTFSPQMALAQDALDAVKSASVLRVGMLVDVPPFGLVNDQGQPDGYDADVAKGLAEHLGLKIQIVSVNGPNRIPYLLTSQVDVLVAALGITEERAQQVDFSAPYSQLGAVVYGPVGSDVKSFEDLADKTIGLPRGGSQDPVVTKSALPSTTIQRYDDDAGAVQALLAGQVEYMAIATNLVPQVEAMAPGRFENKFALYSQTQGIATRKGEKPLMDEINAYLTEAKSSGKLEALYQKWLGTGLPDNLK